jgi:hypothetical protein
VLYEAVVEIIMSVVRSRCVVGGLSSARSRVENGDMTGAASTCAHTADGSVDACSPVPVRPTTHAVNSQTRRAHVRARTGGRITPDHDTGRPPT